MRTRITLLLTLTAMCGSVFGATAPAPKVVTARADVSASIIRVFPLKHVSAAEMLLRLNPSKGVTVTGTPPLSSAPAPGSPAPIRSAAPQIKGIKSLIAQEKDNALTAEGTAEGIEELSKTIARLDVAPKTVRLEAKILRFSFTPEGLEDVSVVSSPRVLTQSGQQATITISGGDTGFALDMAPTANQDGSVSLQGQFRLLGSQGNATRISAFSRRLEANRSLVVAGVTNSKDLEITNIVSRGLIPERLEQHSALYLQIVAARAE